MIKCYHKNIVGLYEDGHVIDRVYIAFVLTEVNKVRMLIMNTCMIDRMLHSTEI